MKRRTLVGMGAAAATLLAVVGVASHGALKPAREQGRLTASSLQLMTAVAQAVLAGALPVAGPDRAAALTGHAARLEVTLSGLSPALQAEVDRLLALLSSAAGRVVLMGLTTPWDTADTRDVQIALQDLRTSRLALRQQVYRALRDLTNAAYFAEPATWKLLGYPGPRTI